MSSILPINLSDLAYAFLSVILEGIPFLLFGTLISGGIAHFVTSKHLVRLIPKQPIFGIILCGGLGLVFPMCECGIVPVIRRLIAKGLPVSHGITYMLAAPIVNPIVAISTFAAFQGQSPEVMVLVRLGLGFIVAVIAGSLALLLPLSSILKPEQQETPTAFPNEECGCACGGESPLPQTNQRNRLTGISSEKPNFSIRIFHAIELGLADFLSITPYFILGSIIAALFGTGVNQECLLPIANHGIVAIASLMGLASILSVCSTSDAFIAASFVTFPGAAKMAFLLFGPVVDLKLLCIYTSLFKKRFIAGLTVVLFILIFSFCLFLFLSDT